jgi:hypothetical protein
VRSVKSECLSRLILFGEGSLRHALRNFCDHYHAERNHQGKDNQVLFPRPDPPGVSHRGAVRCGERLGVSAPGLNDSSFADDVVGGPGRGAAGGGTPSDGGLGGTPVGNTPSWRGRGKYSIKVSKFCPWK